MSARILALLLIVGSGCGQQLVDFLDEEGHGDGGVDQSVGDLRGVDLTGVDLSGDGLTSNPDTDGGDLSFPLDLAGDMIAPCRALQLDGVHAAVTAGPESFYNTGGNVTVEGWVYQTARSASEAVVVGHYGDTSSSDASYVLTIDATGHPVFHFSSSGTSVTTVTSTSVVPLSTWTHVAGQFTANVLGSTLATFVNGGAANTAAVSLAFSPASVTVPLSIGRYSTASPAEHPFTGYIHDVRVSSTTRYPGTPAVRLLPDGNTVALYHFDESSGSNAADASLHAIPGALLQNAMFAAPPACP